MAHDLGHLQDGFGGKNTFLLTNCPALESRHGVTGSGNQIARKAFHRVVQHDKMK
jgi:hypothetical protein